MKKTTGQRSTRRKTRGRTSRYETVATVGTFTRRKPSSRTRRLFREWEKKQHRPRRRRSKARLGAVQRAARYEATASVVRAVVGAPARTLQRFNGRLVLNVLVLGLCALLGTWFFVSEEFYVNRVEVTGNQQVSTETIVKASGLYGYSIFWVNPPRVAARIEESLPPIRGVTVHYSLPNTVSLEVEEAGEQFVWEVSGTRYWVDEEGDLHPVPDGSEPRLIVRDVRAVPPERVDSQALVAAQQIMHLLPEVRVVEYTPTMGLRFMHSRGWLVYLGTGEDMAHKVNVLRAMEAQMGDEETGQPVRVDLRFPEGPYWRLRTQDAGGE